MTAGPATEEENMKPILCLALVVAAICSLSSAALADDLFQPTWRGQEGTTFEKWEFNSSANPADPDVINNPYGTASAAITLGRMGDGWINQYPGLGTPTGYWDIGAPGTPPEGPNGQIVIDIDNRLEPLPYKEIWVQVTCFKDTVQPPIVSVPGATLLEDPTLTVVEDAPPFGEWVLQLTKWRIEPNPSHEQVILSADPLWGATIDEVVIDTICIPEPATFGLLVVGCLVAFRRRRRA
jgi:hypothetical protein